MTFIYRYLMAGALMLSAITSSSQTSTEVSDTSRRVNRLKEVIVRGFGADRNLKAAEMGRVMLSDQMILDLPVMFGEPDIVKTLQTLPGVSQGVEGFTGLYVRGGENDQNLFLYQGLPLYHVSHLGGIFSSFNVATVRSVDFYKSAFPAQYGGRISSITDVGMKPSDFEKYHGRFTLGLLSANAFLTGPIVRDKTAFSVGLRRSWVDLVSIPTLAILNAIEKKNGKKHIGGYAFTDFNARIDHKFNSRASIYAVGYYGHDRMKLGLREFDPDNGNNSGDDVHFYDEDVNRMSWGNWGVLGAFDYHIGPGVWNTSVYYSHYASTYRQEREYQSDTSDPETYGFSRQRTENGIADVGVQTSYQAEFGKIYRLRAGLSYVHHQFHPESIRNELLIDGLQETKNNGNPVISSDEVAGYADNNFNFRDIVALSLGVRGTMYRIQGHTFTDWEPRAALKVAAGRNFSIKAGYARMHQYVQQISSNYINLPTDLWQPITAQFKPLESDQYSVGFYGNLPLSMYFSVEGWYKDMRNLLEYREGVSSLNPDIAWDDKLTDGKGWSYGVDFTLTREQGRLTGSVGYGLMWNWRKFEELNHGLKFPAKFDNRHKININLSYKLNDRIDLNAGWTYMTGNRLTLSLYNYDIPGSQFPDAPTVGIPGFNENDGIDYYPKRNNVRMPAYHRLDLGVNLHKNYKNGRKGIWNFSLYNAYCHMNAITIKKDNDNDLLSHPSREGWHRAFKTLSFIPVIPSVSYTYIF